MPKEVPITRRVLIEITKKLLSDGWELMLRQEIAEDIRKYELTHHRSQPRNIGFKRSDGKGHTVKLWLSCDYDLAVEYKKTMPLYLDLPVSFPSGVGMLWVLIVNAEGRAIYFATPRNRSLNLEENFLFDIEVTWRRVEYWPACKKCGAEMVIAEDPNHGNYWACFKLGDHADYRYDREDWNVALTPEQRKIKEAGYRKRAKVRRQRKKAAKAEGKPDPQKAHDIRIPWKSGDKPSYPPAA